MMYADGIDAGENLCEELDHSNTDGGSKPSKAAKNHKGRRQMDDDFMMRLYKIKMCTRTTPHNWKLCPWAHPGETAALRRDPSTHMAEMCPAVRQHQDCPHGEGCLYARNTFECHLHPFRYRTTMCTSGEACTRNICFFAHNQQELRMPPEATMQQWALPASGMSSLSSQVSNHSQPTLDPQEMTLDMLLPQADPYQMQVATDAAARVPLAVSVSGPLTAPLMNPLNWTGACGVGSTKAHSSPLPVVSVGMAALPARASIATGASTAGGPWVASALSPQGSAGALGYNPSLSHTSPAAQGMQLQMLLQDSQQQPLDPSVYAAMPSPQAAQYGPVSAAHAAGLHAGMHPAAAMTGPDSSVVMPLGPQQQQEWLLLQQQQYAAAVPALNGTPSAGNPAAQHTLSLPAHLQAVPGVAGSMGDLQGLQDMAWQQQQAASLQQTMLLLQQLQLAGGRPPSGQLPSDSVTSTLLGSSSNYSTGPLRHPSQLTMSDLSTDSLAGFVPAGFALTQDLGQGSNSAVYLGSGPLRTNSTQLLPLQAAGLIQMSALNDGPSALEHAQQQQRVTMPVALPVTMPMQQQGRYW